MVTILRGILLCILFVGCVSNRDGFSIYKKPPFTDVSNICIKTNGAYVRDYGSLFFYNNGLVKRVLIDSSEVSSYDWSSTKIKKESTRYDDNDEFWGHYICDGNELRLQIFNKHNQEMVKRRVYENKIRINKDSTLSIYSSVWLSGLYKDYINNDDTISEPDVFRFYKTKNKPDSTKAWFINKKWYKNNLYLNQ
jgi:hypothetical protein